MQEEQNIPDVRVSDVAEGGMMRGFGLKNGITERSMDQSSRSDRSKIAKTFDAIITVSLTALFFGLPIFFTGVTSQGIVFEKQLYFYFWLLIGLVAWVSKGIIAGEMRIRRTPLDIPIGIFVLVYGISTLFSVDRWESFWGSYGDPSRGLLSVIAIALAYYLIASHFTVKRFKLMFGGLVASSFLVVAWSFLVVMNIRFLPGSAEAFMPFSLLGTVTTLALFLSVAPALFLTSIFTMFHDGFSGAKWWKTAAGVVLGISILLDFFLLLALYAYVSWAVVIGGMGFLLIYILAQIVRPAEQMTWIPMALFVLVLAFLMVGQTDIARANLPVEVIPKFSFAFDIAKKALGDHFLLGAGPANYSYAFSMYRPVEYNQNSLFTLRFDQAPGLFMEALSTIGTLGTIAFLVLALSFVSVGIYLLSNGRNRNKVYSLGLWSVSVMFFIAAFISAFNGSIVLLSSMIGILAITALLWESGAEEQYLNLSFQASPKFALALAFIFMVVSAGVAFLFVFIGKVFVADIMAGRATRVATVSEDSALSLARAVQMYPQEPQYRVGLGQIYVSLANQEASKPAEEGDANRVVAFIREAINQTETARKLSPNSVRVAESLGLVYENSSLYTAEALSKALESYETALTLEPNSPVLLVKIGQIKRAIGEREQDPAKQAELFTEAKDRFREAVDKKDNFAIAHYNLAVALSRLKEYTPAMESLERAIRIEPSNITYIYSLGSLYQLRKEDGDLDKAEAVYKSLFQVNERLADVRLALGLLYEEKGEPDLALTEYRTLLDFLPEGDQGAGIRAQVEAFISNLEAGKSNVAGAAAPELPQPEPTPAVPAQTEEGIAPAGEEAAIVETVPAPELPVVEGGE